MDARAKDAQISKDRREVKELFTLLTLSRSNWDKGRPNIEQRIAYLLKRHILNSWRSTDKWSVLSRSCDICQQLQPSAQELITHRFNSHSCGGSKPVQIYSCLMCYKTTSSKLKLHTHIVRVHTNVSSNHNAATTRTTIKKIYKCSLCPKAFTSKGNLQTHSSLHTGQKQYKCDVCRKCFSQHGNMIIHKRVHSGEKPYKCDVCHNCFSQRGNMMIHKRLHTGEKPYKCDVCHECFTNRGNMTKHKRLHTGEKSYKCDVCHKCFKRVEYLRKHKRIYHGDKPYV